MLQTKWRLIYPHAKCSFYSHFPFHRSIFCAVFLHFSKLHLLAELLWWLIALRIYLIFKSFWFMKFGPELALMRHPFAYCHCDLSKNWLFHHCSHGDQCFTKAYLSSLFYTSLLTALISSFFFILCCHPYPLYLSHSHLLTVASFSYLITNWRRMKGYNKTSSCSVEAAQQTFRHAPVTALNTWIM